MSTPYQISIEMEQETVEALRADGYYLFGFKAVKASGAGKPLVWFRTLDYATETKLNWVEQYQAYTAKSEIISKGQITASNSYSIDLGQTLNVTGSAGTGSVDTQHGTAHTISIHNLTTTRFTTGISQPQPMGQGTSPMCAFNLYGLNLDEIAPIEQVLLMFSTKPVITGTVAEEAYSSGLIIDLTARQSRTVKYMIDDGWAWDGGAWGIPVEANDSLVPLLIQGD
ncbi:MAG TPA: hypothetical protein VFR48_03710 [Solirubrobacteraceae bacterium]|nr:hypothetical protein [Solirubrobacteraceae bacterium]